MEAAGALQVWPQFRGDNDSACDGWRSSSSVMRVRSSYFCVLCMWTCSGALLLCERVLANCHDLLRHLIELSPCQCYWSHLWFPSLTSPNVGCEKASVRAEWWQWRSDFAVSNCQKLSLAQNFAISREEKIAPACLYFFQPITITLGSKKAKEAATCTCKIMSRGNILYARKRGPSEEKVRAASLFTFKWLATSLASG